jgi:hypothetical protein
MSATLGMRLRATPGPFFRPVQPSLLQRKSCGGSHGLAECERCGKSSFSASDSDNQPLQASPNHDFGRVRVHAESTLNGDSHVGAGSGGDVFINGPGPEETPKETPKPKPQPKKPAKPACPTDINVIYIEQLNDPQFGKNNMLTGIGAVAYMEVSDPGNNDWDGTKITETVKQTKNTCGARARKVCSNVSGQNVDFKVGAATKVINKKMDALRNTFYDQHAFALTDHSILHELGKDSCEIECEQSYQCGGKDFGPKFVITYTGSKDTIAKTYDVTRIKVDKKAKAAKP